MEVNGAYMCHRNDGPRELEIFSDEQVEEVLESLEYFRTKIEQLQMYCEQVNQSKLRADEVILEQKRKHRTEIAKYQEEINLLRSINIQLMTGKVASADKRGNFSVSSLSCAIDSENAESRIQEMESKVRSLELTLAEKEKHVSVMEWQLMDMEATIAALQAERDQLVLELELREVRENFVQESDNLGAVEGNGRNDDYHEDERHSEETEIKKKKKRNPRRPHSDLLGSMRTPENLSLKQLLSLSAEWSTKETPFHTRKPLQRHYSDYVKRDSRVRCADFSRGDTTHSLEDFDNLSEVDSGLGLGKLTRTTNFCDILDADEYSNFHVADNRLSFTADSLLGEQVNNDGDPETESSRESLSKRWETFDGEQNGKRNPFKMSSGNGLRNRKTAGSLGDTNFFDEQSLGSSASDFSSALSSQDILMNSSQEAWTSIPPGGCSVNSPKTTKKKLAKKKISKSDSCIITSKSPPSDKEDMWNFTPDSILNVSTGEVLIPSVVETPPSPSLKKSRSFTSSIEIVLKDPKSKTNKEKSDESADEDQTDNTEETGDDNTMKETVAIRNSQSTSVGSGSHDGTSVSLRDNLGESLRAKHYGKSRSVIEFSEQTHDKQSTRHQKSLSDPVQDDDRNEQRKLIEYQKWRKCGRRGRPPGDLKISDC